jgi:hypothetical protein
MPKAGGSPQVLATSQNTPIAVTANASGVYWANEGQPGMHNGSVMSDPANGVLFVLASQQGTVEDIAVEGSNVYWVTSDDGKVMRAPAAGGGMATVLASGEEGAISLAVDASYVYWVNDCFGTIKRIAK